jgi:hypothetical protein
VVLTALHHAGDNMRKRIAFLLFLIIITTLNPINVNASDSNDIIYEIVKRNPSLVITGCNETYVYWEFNIKIFDPPIAIREYGSNESTYMNKRYSNYYWELIFIYDMLAAKYDLKYSRWDHYAKLIEGIEGEIKPLQDKIFEEKGELGINWIGVRETIPPAIIVSMYKITNKKINIVLEYLKPFVKKYHAIVFFIEDYRPASIFEKQDEALDKFYDKILPNGTILYGKGDGFLEYLNLVKEYYNFTIPVGGFVISPGIANLPIPTNATFNEEFVREAVSILRKYASCEVPLVVNFVDYREFNVNPQPLPANPSDTQYPSLPYLILLFVVIPIVILLPLVLILRKANRKK